MTVEALHTLWRQAAETGRLSQSWAVVCDPAGFAEVENRAVVAFGLAAADVLAIEPEPQKRVLARATIMPWLQQARLVPRGARQLAVIRHAELLQPVTANLLLKPLEEPPLGTIFLLLLARDNVLTTIRSRVQMAVLDQAASDDHFVVPETISAIIQEVSSLLQGDAWSDDLRRLVGSLRPGLAAGTIDPTDLQRVLRLVTTSTAGLNRKLQLTALLSHLST